MLHSFELGFYPKHVWFYKEAGRDGAGPKTNAMNRRLPLYQSCQMPTGLPQARRVPEPQKRLEH